METRKFKKLLKEERNLQKIIYDYINCKINLTDAQLSEIIDIKNGKRDKHDNARSNKNK